MEVDPNVVGVDFKHFVRSPISDRRAVAEALLRAGYETSSQGDQRGDRWRMWFLLPDYATYGGNNTFAE